MAYEQLQYKVIRKYDNFELRYYERYNVAESTVSGKFNKVGNDAFRILVRYLSGNNRRKMKIPMTSPVEQSPDIGSGERIAMTTPVLQTPHGQQERESYVVRFIMPSNYTLDTLPEPEDPRISIRQVDARFMAVRSYSGTWSEKRYRKNEAVLLQAVQTAGLTAIGEPIFARYNPPFTLWFLRRNEVLVEVKAEEYFLKGTLINAG